MQVAHPRHRAGACTLNAVGLLPVSGRGDARVAPPCPTTLCVWRRLPYLKALWGLTVALLLAEILNVVQVFIPAHAVTVCYCCYCCSAASKQKMAKPPGKTRKYLGFSGYFRVLPALDAGDRRGSLPGLPYCCSAGLTLATVVGEPHCCSVVTVNTSNTVQLLTFDSSRPGRRTGREGGGSVNP